MRSVSGYEILEKTHETFHSIIYRAKKKDDKETRIIKVLKREYPDRIEIALFKREYELVKAIANDGIVKTIDLMDFEKSYAIVMEDFGGVSLKDIYKDKPVEIKEFFRIAARIAEILGHIHPENIIHKDIKPANILYNAKTGIVKLTDFGTAVLTGRAKVDVFNPEIIQGTLAYISPEQSGRINNAVDYRTDIYSLGVSFYRLATGRLPFVYNDPMELIHAHIARLPEPPHLINPEIPEMLSVIIMKCMAKNAQDRYQNGFGLLHDLRACALQYEKTGGIEVFAPGEKDIPLKCMPPGVIVGREEELDRLQSAFARAMQGNLELFLVSGAPGIGKSALINELQKSVFEKRGYFLEGKFDQYRRDVPYSAFIMALQILLGQILSSNKEELARWREKIQTAVGGVGKVLVDLIPRLELIIGKQPEVTELGNEQTLTRLRQVFIEFIKVFLLRERPMVLFIDDLQWADIATIDLLKHIAKDTELGYILIICSYRDNEVFATHPFFIAVDEIKKSGKSFDELVIKPLSPDRTATLTANFLRGINQGLDELSSIIYAKTLGNPFFINQFIQTLFEQKIIFIDAEKGWQWDSGAAANLSITDNVVDLLTTRFDTLSKNTRELLILCACIGSRFDLTTLSAVSKRPLDEIVLDTMPALEQGYIIASGDNYRFGHDRIQETIHSLISDETRSKLHYAIGTYTMESTPAEKLDEKILYIADQFNLGIFEIITPEEKVKLAELNCSAGKKARESAAFKAALHYCEIGIDLLQADGWQKAYDLTHALHLQKMKIEYALSQFDVMRMTADILLKNARHEYDNCEVYLSLMVLNSDQNDKDKAVAIGFTALKNIGYKKLNTSINPLRLLKEVIKLKYYFKKYTNDEILNFKETCDPRDMFITSIFRSLVNITLYGNIYLSVKSNLHFTNYLLRKKALTASAAASFGGVGVVAWHYIKDIHLAQRLYSLMEKVSERLKNRAIFQDVLYVMGVYYIPWVKHMENGLDYCMKNYHTSLENGEVSAALSVLLKVIATKYSMGINLVELREEIEKYIQFIEKIKIEGSKVILYFLRQFCLNMAGETVDKYSLKSSDFDAEHACQELKNKNEFANLTYKNILQITIHVIHGNYDGALEYCKIYLKYRDTQRGNFEDIVFVLFYSLVLASLYPNASLFERLTYRRQLAKNKKEMEVYLRFNRVNVPDKLNLIYAEIAVLKNNFKQATLHYQHAIDEASKNKFTQHEAIACERAAMFMLRQGCNDIASYYLMRSYNGYLRWGATLKARNMLEQYGGLIDTVKPQTHTAKTKGENTIENTVIVSSVTTSLDISTVMKASQAISGEIVFAKLLEKMMRIAMENAGAQKGALLLAETSLYVEVQAQIGDGHSDMRIEHIALDEFADIPKTIIHYVERTAENLILDNAVVETQGTAPLQKFTDDPYIQKNNPASILCTPIMHQGRLSGIIYLENNLAAGAFTLERIEVLNVLASQMAISIDNARLYLNLEDKVKERTNELLSAMEELEAINEELTRTRDALWGEMQLAKKIQTVLVPTKPTMQGYEILGYMEPADEVGGDYYDVIHTDGADWVIIGDVSGHGVPAGLVMMMVQTATQAIVREFPKISPSELLKIVNRAVHYNIKNLGENKYMTITMMRVDAGGKITYAGQHQDILIYRSSSGNVEDIATCGMWLGILEDISGNNTDEILQLAKDDVMLLFTDGITEASDDQDSMFGENRLAALLKNIGGRPLEDFKQALLYDLEGFTIADDVTFLLVKRN